MIKAVFYTRFHPEKGPRVLHQVPEGAIVPLLHPQALPQQPLFDFTSISDLIIPRQEFCDRLVTVCINHYRIIGHPVCIEHPSYDRNQFIFNLALVLDEDADFSGYKIVVKKLASLFRNLEEQSGFLSKDEAELKPSAKTLWGQRLESPPLHRSTEDSYEAASDLCGTASLSNSIELGGDAVQSTKVYALCEMILEDLNNYCECMIPIDDANTINLKLFQQRPPPAPVYAWHVPLATVQLTTLNISSDLTMNRILEFIDGVSSVAQIAQLADTDLGLTRKAIAHLLYYRCVLLLDIFQFSAVYAPTAEIGAFAKDEEAQEEAARYVSIGHYRLYADLELDGSSKEQWITWKSGQESGVIDKTTLVQLYTSLRQGLSLKNWCHEHSAELKGIDVRRFITFGIIRGFLYRVHKYVIADGATLAGEQDQGRYHEDWGYVADPESRRPSRATSEMGKETLPLAKFLDGMHCFDEICTELQLSEKKVLEKIRGAYGNVQIIHR